MDIYKDGFDHYGEEATGLANMLAGPDYAEISSMWPSTVDPRTGTYCLRNRSTSNAEFVRIALPSARSKLFLGAAWTVDHLPVDENDFSMFQVRNNSNDPLATVLLMTTGGIQVREGDVGGSIIAEGDPIFPVDVWTHVEACFDRVGQTVEVRVNGVVACSATGVDMGLDNFAQYTLGPLNVGAATRQYAIDDHRAGDDLGGSNDDFMGDKVVLLRLPIADASPSDFTPSAGSDRFAMVDEVGPDDGTTYIESANPGELQRFQFEDLPAGVVAVHSIAFVTYAAKTDAGTADLATNVVSNGQKGLGTEHALALDYAYLPQQTFDLDPDGDIPWTLAKVDALESELEHVGGS
jgi:hypothetical protein